MSAQAILQGGYDLKPYVAMPNLRPINGKEYTLETPYTYEWTYVGNNKRYRITVHQYFITDGASVPRWLWSIIPKDGQWRAGALIHDYFYAYQGAPPFLEVKNDKGEWEPANTRLSREECDNLFLQLMLEGGVTPEKAKTMFRAVRIFGQGPWNNG